MPEAPVDQLISHLFRTESGKMASVLTRMLGFSNYDTAEDIVQDTLLKAVNTWKFKGIPDHPQAWLYTVAKRKAIDVIRQGALKEKIHSEIVNAMHSEWTLTPTVNQLFLDHEIEDSQLRMIFACCHPDIPYESQLALTLKTLCGLSVNEIAKAFLTTDDVITKRIYRAREKIREENITLEVPSGKLLNERLEAVWHTLYLLFNEGYNSSQPEHFIRQDLCQEALRLCLLLTRDKKTNRPESNALLALMCFQAARENARTDADGEIILLRDQDRALWNHDLLAKAFEYLNVASTENALSEYHLEAAIGATHAMAKRFEETDWTQILLLYESLEKLKPGPITAFNKAIATGYARGPEHGLHLLLEMDSQKNNNKYYVALGDFYVDLNQKTKAIEAYDRALELTTSDRERNLLTRKKIATQNTGQASE